jgi:asparagine synthase (glutamine-hydrolysing)
MCGIAGFIGRGDRDDLLRMMDDLRHRGPDAQGIWTDEASGLHLGHTRLFVLDPAGGHQPMTNRDTEITIVYNGEIYNHHELRKELEAAGHCFSSSHSDTEVLLHGYSEWGTGLPEHLNGMWAFAIFARRSQKLFLSRDRFGQKPLFYTYQNGTFAFASELAALARHRSVGTSMSILSLQKYLAYGFIPAPHSLYDGVHKLPGGHNLILDTKQLVYDVSEYWRFRLEPQNEMQDDALPALSEEFRERLQSAIEMQLTADVPLGVFLSGGLDSSCLAALAAEVTGGAALKTFSVGFDDPQFNEAGFAKQVADAIGSDHRTTWIAMQELPTLAAEAVAKLDEPLGDNSIVPTYLLCKSARPDVTVALGGDGADELLAGYDPCRIVRLADCYARWMPRPVHRAIRTVVAMLPCRQGYMPFDFKLKRLFRGLEHPGSLWNPVWLGPLDPVELRECFLEPVDVQEIYSEAIALWDKSESATVVEKTMEFYTQLYLQDDILVKIDRASMMCSLELRSPFLDLDVVNFLRQLPTRFKLRGGQTKFLLREVARDLIPPEIVQKPKHGFPFPAARSFREKRLQIDRGFPARMNPEFVYAKEQRHLAGKEDNRMFLWCHWLLSRYAKRTAGNGD